MCCFTSVVVNFYYLFFRNKVALIAFSHGEVIAVMVIAVVVMAGSRYLGNGSHSVLLCLWTGNSLPATPSEWLRTVTPDRGTRDFDLTLNKMQILNENI